MAQEQTSAPSAAQRPDLRVLAFNKAQISEPNFFDGEAPWADWLFFGSSSVFTAFETEAAWFVLVAGQAVGGNLQALPAAAETEALAGLYGLWGGLVMTIAEAESQRGGVLVPPLLVLPSVEEAAPEGSGPLDPEGGGPLLGLFALPFWAFEMQEAYLRVLEGLFALFIFVYLQHNPII